MPSFGVKRSQGSVQDLAAANLHGGGHTSLTAKLPDALAQFLPVGHRLCIIYKLRPQHLSRCVQLSQNVPLRAEQNLRQVIEVPVAKEIAKSHHFGPPRQSPDALGYFLQQRGRGLEPFCLGGIQRFPLIHIHPVRFAGGRSCALHHRLVKQRIVDCRKPANHGKVPKRPREHLFIDCHRRRLCAHV